MTVRNMKTLNPDVDKAELLALLLDVLMAAEAKMSSGSQRRNTSSSTRST